MATTVASAGLFAAHIKHGSRWVRIGVFAHPRHIAWRLRRTHYKGMLGLTVTMKRVQGDDFSKHTWSALRTAIAIAKAERVMEYAKLVVATVVAKHEAMCPVPQSNEQHN